MRLSLVLTTQQTQFQAATLSGDLRANLTALKSMGYQGVELAIRDPFLIDEDVLSTLMDEFGLQVPAIGTGQAWGEEGLSFTDPDPETRHAAIGRVISHIMLAAHFKAVVIIGLIRGVLKAGVSHAQAMDWLTQALQECSQVAEHEGVRLALEPINRYETSLINNVDDGMRLVDTIASPNFGLLLDTFHMNIEEPDMETSIRTCGERIFHFHVADSNRWYPGAGHLKFASILNTLSSQGYEGFISGEFLPKPDAMTAAGRNIAYLKPLIEKLTLDRGKVR
jgi:sugar phosphate isomerase/epimerase